MFLFHQERWKEQDIDPAERYAHQIFSPCSTSKERLSIWMSSCLGVALQKSSRTQCTASVTLYGTALFSFILLLTITLPFRKLRISSALNPVRLVSRYGSSCWNQIRYYLCLSIFQHMLVNDPDSYTRLKGLYVVLMFKKNKTTLDKTRWHCCITVHFHTNGKLF